MKPYCLGVDIGTTGTKTILLHVEHGIVAQATRESPLYSDAPGFAEADPLVWYRNVVESIREILSRSGVVPEQVGAVATSGMVPAVVPVDAGGRPLRKAILQNDARATAEIEQVATALAGADVVALTGSAVSQQSVAPTALWLARHEPDLWAATAHLVGSYDWVLVALGAAPHVELNWAVESGLFTLDGQLFEPALHAGGLERDRVPQILRPGSQAGELSAEAAEATGLVAGTPLIVGGADHVLSAFAAGVEQPGDWLVKLGGAGDILVASDSAIVDPRLYLDVHPVPGRWLPNGCMATSGSLIRWFQNIVGGDDLRQLDVEAADRPAAEVLCLPYFLGEKSPLHDPDLRGTFAGLHLGHTRADLYRSVLEAIAFGFRHHAEIFQEIGVPLTRAMVTNGGSKSRLWKQIHANVLGTELYPVVDHPGASLGAALIAGIGTGALDNWGDGKRFLTLDDPVMPDESVRTRYSDAYEQWRALNDAVRPISHALAERRES
ncbi:FGGY-family carbohydrate kinase [Georgenia sp.]